jgi:hypothetical protein
VALCDRLVGLLEADADAEWEHEDEMTDELAELLDSVSWNRCRSLVG